MQFFRCSNSIINFSPDQIESGEFIHVCSLFSNEGGKRKVGSSLCMVFRAAAGGQHGMWVKTLPGCVEATVHI